MNVRKSSPARAADIEHQAAAWLARRDRGLTAAEQDELFRWLAEDPRHGEWFARHQRTVRGLRVLAQWRPEHAAVPNPDLLAQRSARRTPHWIFTAGLATAAGLMLAAVWWQRSPANSRPPATAAPALAAQSRVLRKLLEDGSTIDLNRGAEVDVRFTAAERRVRLVRGEAQFNVAKNPARPFVVEVERVEVRAVGTAFNVRLQPQTIEVLVTEGRVQVRPPEAAAHAELPVVDAGERAIVSLTDPSAPPRITPVAAQVIAQLLAWQPRQLEFTDAPLAQVVAEFNRDNPIKIVVDDPALAAMPIGATLRSDNVDGFVRLLESSFHLTVERRADGVIVLRSAAPATLR